MGDKRRFINKKLFWEIYFYLIGKSEKINLEGLTKNDIISFIKSSDIFSKYSPKLSFLFNQLNNVVVLSDENKLKEYFLSLLDELKNIFRFNKISYLGLSKNDLNFNSSDKDKNRAGLLELVKNITDKETYENLRFLFSINSEFEDKFLRFISSSRGNNEIPYYGAFCLNCPLSEFNLKKVPYEIKKFDENNKSGDEVDIVFIGINPGKEEREQGRPFVGKSGKILRKFISEYLEKNSISYAITNQIKCSTDNTEQLKNNFQISLPQIYDNYCSKYLEEELEKFNPKIIVLIGNDAYSLFVNNKRLLEKFKDKKLIKIKHPSYYVRKGITEEKWNKVEEYKKIFSEIVEELKTNSAPQSLTENKEKKLEINKDKLFVEINSIDEIPKDFLLLNINVLEKENKFLIIASHKETNEIVYFKMPFFAEFYISPRPFYYENDYVEKVENLERVKINDYFEYKKLIAAKRAELKDIISSPISENGKKVLNQIMKLI